LARSAAVYGGPLGVRVNAIAPGIVATGRHSAVGDQAGGGGDWAERARIAPLRRAGTADEIGALVAYLLSDDASFVTGEVVSIDGGAGALNPVRPSGQRPSDPTPAT
jgi:NAD(P)-dependent dehydrogenase (short-subunit alcohol dehydrogenase family)